MKIFFRPEAYTAHTFSNRASSFSRFVFCVLCILSSSFSFRILCSVQTIITYHCILNILYSVMIYSVMICSVMIYSLIIYSVFAVQTRVTSVPAEVISRLSTKSPQSQSNHAHPPSSSRKVGQKIKNKWNLRGKNEITNWKRPPIGGPQANPIMLIHHLHIQHHQTDYHHHHHHQWHPRPPQGPPNVTEFWNKLQKFTKTI